MKTNVRFIDIHNHVLPTVDDGSKSIEMSVEMIKKYIHDGVTDLILTPHNYNSVQTKSRAEQVMIFNQLQEEVKKLELTINLHLGAEVMYREHLKINYKDFTLANSNYILIEFSQFNDASIVDVCYNLKTQGFKPIIAHIERYDYLTKKEYDILKNDGVLFQVNAKSVFKDRKEWHNKFKFLLKKAYIDFIATDAHNMSNRAPNLKDAYDHVKKIIDEDYLNKIFYDNARKIIEAA